MSIGDTKAVAIESTLGGIKSALVGGSGVTFAHHSFGGGELWASLNFGGWCGYIIITAFGHTSDQYFVIMCPDLSMLTHLNAAGAFACGFEAFLLVQSCRRQIKSRCKLRQYFFFNISCRLALSFMSWLAKVVFAHCLHHLFFHWALPFPFHCCTTVRRPRSVIIYQTATHHHCFHMTPFPRYRCSHEGKKHTCSPFFCFWCRWDGMKEGDVNDNRGELLGWLSSLDISDFFLFCLPQH